MNVYKVHSQRIPSNMTTTVDSINGGRLTDDKIRYNIVNENLLFQAIFMWVCSLGCD